MGGELEGITEPALVLTPPTQGSTDEDGLLSASEIAQLSLNADWVLLSACNTAVGAGGGEAEGLSGLARAFFYAGARRLLVSHWSVQSDPTVALTTGMFRAKPLVGDDPTGARALRHLDPGNDRQSGAGRVESSRSLGALCDRWRLMPQRRSVICPETLRIHACAHAVLSLEHGEISAPKKAAQTIPKRKRHMQVTETLNEGLKRGYEITVTAPNWTRKSPRTDRSPARSRNEGLPQG